MLTAHTHNEKVNRMERNHELINPKLTLINL